MIYFITNEENHLSHYREKLYDNITVLPDNKETFTLFESFIKETKLVGYDVETNGLNEWTNDLIIKVFGDANTQFVFHSPFCDFKRYLDCIIYYYPTLIGHNIKFDVKFLYTKYNRLYDKVYDTMVAEQRIYMKLGIQSSLEALKIRYLNKYPDKTIRLEFVNKDVKKFFVEPIHIYYIVEDIIDLFPIKDVQEKNIEKWGLEFLIKGIEFPLISIIAKAEATGFEFDKEKWEEIYKENKEKLFEVECELDKEFRRLRDESFGNPKEGGLTYMPEKRIFISGGKWDNVRKKDIVSEYFNDDGTVNTPNLFGEPMKINTYLKSRAKNPVKVKKNRNNINYNSSTEIIYIFGRLEEPLLDEHERVVHVKFNKKGKVDRNIHSYKTNEGSLSSYLTIFPGTRMKTFIELLLKHRGLSKATSTYGVNFINNLNSVTGKLHTNFKQCVTDTGRMSSGGGNKEPDKPNFQNIPSKADYAVPMRNCFLAREGYSIGTHDLSGAELIIMCSLSQDLKLLKIAKEDIHSYIAQGSWRLIFKKRAKELIEEYNANYRKNSNYKNPSLKDKVRELIKKSKSYIVNKSTEKGKVRTTFKPMAFGTIYGMYAKKAAKTLNVAIDEAQLVIDFIKREFPDVFNMVERASAFAKANGYVILNSRTNSRAWFPNIIKLLKGQLDPKRDWRLISKEESEARNIRIQGTQADMIKEMTVELQKWINNNELENEITILSWVHDEIIDEHPKYLDGKSKEWKEYTLDGTVTCLTYNNKNYSNFPELKAQIMRDVANKYLNNVEMDVDFDVEPFWTK